MIRTLVAFLVLALAAMPASAADTPGRIMGILIIPSIFAYQGEVMETPQLPIYQSPTVTAPVIATAGQMEHGVTVPDVPDAYLAELAYEEKGFDVLAEQDGWYKVLIRRDAEDATPLTGWVLPPKDAEFTELTTYLQDRTIEFTPAWDGKLYILPGRPELATIIPQNPATVQEQVDAGEDPALASRVIGFDVSASTVLPDGSVWIRAHLKNLCSFDGQGYGIGWVRLPDDWRTLIYHYSRGC